MFDAAMYHAGQEVEFEAVRVRIVTQVSKLHPKGLFVNDLRETLLLKAAVPKGVRHSGVSFREVVPWRSKAGGSCVQLGSAFPLIVSRKIS